MTKIELTKEQRDQDERVAEAIEIVNGTLKNVPTKVKVPKGFVLSGTPLRTVALRIFDAAIENDEAKGAAELAALAPFTPTGEPNYQELLPDGYFSTLAAVHVAAMQCWKVRFGDFPAGVWLGQNPDSMKADIAAVDLVAEEYADMTAATPAPTPPTAPVKVKRGKMANPEGGATVAANPKPGKAKAKAAPTGLDAARAALAKAVTEVPATSKVPPGYGRSGMQMMAVATTLADAVEQDAEYDQTVMANGPVDRFGAVNYVALRSNGQTTALGKVWAAAREVWRERFGSYPEWRREAAQAEAQPEPVAAKAKGPKPAKSEPADIAADTRPTKGVNVAAWESAEAGILPDLIPIPESNASMRRHIAAMRDLAAAGDAAQLNAYLIGGTNTYSLIARNYRGALKRYLAVKDGAHDEANAG